ncbi:MAG: hypothetical protein B6244_13950 [Candidatus Cloacimonetes bacterium 4572_55]|nr:MAG: hypothetical protein B6244_13950 [Candidatus Cloacimonetes bacterium 4572_55]
MFIASMIIKVNPEKADDLLESLKIFENITTYGLHKDDNIIVVVEAESIEDVEKLSKRLLTEFNEIKGVFPTYVTSDDADGMK